MQARCKLKILAAGMVAIAFAVAGAPAGAMLKNLTEDQVKEAVDHGMKYFDQHPLAFQSPYYYNAGYGYPSALLRTEYFAVSDFIRRSEFQRKYGSQKAHTDTPDRIEDRRQAVAGKLQFLVTVYGREQAFPKDYSFALMAGDKKIEPSVVDAPVMGESSGFKGKLAYAAKVIVEFPADAVDGNEKVALVVTPPKGLGPSGSRNSPFELPFDLSSVK